MRPTERDLMVARAVVGRNVANETDLTALIESLPEPAEPEQAAETERFARIGKLFCELWEAGAPWPVRHWSCDKHKVKGCLRCKTTTAPMVVP